MFKKIKHWFILLFIELVVNKYRIYGQPKLKLRHKTLINRPRLSLLKIKINNTTVGQLLVSFTKDSMLNVNIDYIWTNKKKYKASNTELESEYLQMLFDVFMHWYKNSVLYPTLERENYNYVTTNTILTVSINISKEEDVERFRRIITLYGFNVDKNLTLKDVEFHTPYRDKERITYVTYSRVI